MKLERLKELAGIEQLNEGYEQFVESLQAVFEQLEELEPFADNYDEILADDASERRKLKSVLRKFGKLGERLK